MKNDYIMKNTGIEKIGLVIPINSENFNRITNRAIALNSFFFYWPTKISKSIEAQICLVTFFLTH